MTGAKRRLGPGELAQAWPLLLIVPILILLFAAGPVLVVLGARTLADARAIPGGIETTGVVVDNRESQTRGRTGTRRTYVSRVRFTTEDGQRVTFSGTGDADYHEPGTRVQVSYRPDDPQGAHQIGGNASGWGLLGVGLAMSLVDVLIVRGILRKRRWRRDLPLTA